VISLLTLIFESMVQPEEYFRLKSKVVGEENKLFCISFKMFT